MVYSFTSNRSFKHPNTLLNVQSMLNIPSLGSKCTGNLTVRVVQFGWSSCKCQRKLQATINTRLKPAAEMNLGTFYLKNRKGVLLMKAGPESLTERKKSIFTVCGRYLIWEFPQYFLFLVVATPRCGGSSKRDRAGESDTSDLGTGLCQAQLITQHQQHNSASTFASEVTLPNSQQCWEDEHIISWCLDAQILQEFKYQR